MEDSFEKNVMMSRQSFCCLVSKQRYQWISASLIALLVIVLGMQTGLAQTNPQAASTVKFVELYAFNSGPNLSDGAWPEAAVVRDAAGNLYGTTFFGGAGCDILVGGCGTVFKINTGGQETVLHNFGGAHDGWNPTSSLIFDAAGNLYGTTPGECAEPGWLFDGDRDGRRPCGSGKTVLRVLHAVPRALAWRAVGQAVHHDVCGAEGLLSFRARRKRTASVELRSIWTAEGGRPRVSLAAFDA